MTTRIAFIRPVLLPQHRSAGCTRSACSGRRQHFTKACTSSPQTPQPHPLHAEGIPPFANEPSPNPISESQISEWFKQATAPSPTVRLRAVLLCRHLTPSEAAPILHAAYDAGENELQNRVFLALFFGYKPTSRSYDILTEIVENDDKDEVRANAIAALGYLRDLRAVPMCVGCLRQGHWSVRTASAVSLGMIAEAHPHVGSLVYDDLYHALKEAHGDWGVVIACLGALGDLGDVRAVELVREFVQLDDFAVALCGVEALGKLKCEESLQVLKKVLDMDVHVNVLWAAKVGIKAIEEKLGLQRKS